MNIVYKNQISVEDYNLLREAVEWGKICTEQAKRGLESSSYIISCYDNNNIVGSARIIWDGGYIAFLADVMVLPEYQKRGIGRYMVEQSIDYLKKQIKEEWRIMLVLVAAKGKEEFYEKFGFLQRPNENKGAGMDMWLG